MRWKAHLEALKIAVEADFEWPSFGKSSGGGRSIYFRDPSGNSIENGIPAPPTRLTSASMVLATDDIG